MAGASPGPKDFAKEAVLDVVDSLFGREVQQWQFEVRRWMTPDDEDGNVMSAWPLSRLEGTFAVCRLPADTPDPPWANVGPLASITRTRDEVSLVCPDDRVPDGVRCERGWRCLRVEGTLDFGLVGVLSSLLGPLADARISVFVLSTFDTDYLLIRSAEFERAVEALQRAGHAVA